MVGFLTGVPMLPTYGRAEGSGDSPMRSETIKAGYISNGRNAISLKPRREEEMGRSHLAIAHALKPAKLGGTLLEVKNVTDLVHSRSSSLSNRKWIRTKYEMLLIDGRSQRALFLSTNLFE